MLKTWLQISGNLVVAYGESLVFYTKEVGFGVLVVIKVGLFAGLYESLPLLFQTLFSDLQSVVGGFYPLSTTPTILTTEF